MGTAAAAYHLAIDSGDDNVAPKAAVYLGNMLEGQGDRAGAAAAYRLALHSRDTDVTALARKQLRHL
jgi:hypothetical protein